MKFTGSLSFTWHQANEECTAKYGGDLVSVHDPFEQGKKKLLEAEEGLKMPIVVEHILIASFLIRNIYTLEEESGWFSSCLAILFSVCYETRVTNKIL